MYCRNRLLGLHALQTRYLSGRSAGAFSAVLLAHQFHLSVEIGAFLAGIAIAQLPIHEDLHRRLHPLMTFFVAVFLVTLGIQMNISVLGEVWKYGLVLSVFVIIVKPLIVFTILSRLRYSEYTAFQGCDG